MAAADSVPDLGPSVVSDEEEGEAEHDSPPTAMEPTFSAQLDLLRDEAPAEQVVFSHAVLDSGHLWREHQETGSAYFKNGLFDEAVTEYSAALKLCKEPRDCAELHGGRSAAYAAMAQRYRNRPAAFSEYSALYGMDPSYLAALALKDASKVVELRKDWAEGYAKQGLAFFLLERYAEAEAAYLEGLTLEPQDKDLQAGLRSVKSAVDAEAAVSPAKRQRVSTADTDDYECTLCLKLLYEPVTTPCGHTFCRGCFSRAIDHQAKCPMCRTVLHIGRDLPVTVTLNNILRKSFPQETEERRLEVTGDFVTGPDEAEGGNGSNGSLARRSSGSDVVSLPLFVMSTLLQGEKMALNVFEPRYRLMVRRCMEGNRRIGMAQVKRSDHTVEDVAMEGEITECNQLPDGRYYLEIVGRRRVKLLSTSELDGYRIARAQPFHDAVPEPGSAAEREMSELAAEVERLADSFIGQVRAISARSGGGNVVSLRIREFLERAGEKPARGKHEALSFWVACLLGCDGSERMRLLTLEDTKERLSALRDLMDRRRQSGQCCVM